MPIESAIISLACTVLKKIAAPIGRQFGYVIFYKSNAKQLEEKVSYLEYVMQTLGDSVREATDNGKQIYENVTVWQESARKLVKEVRYLLKYKKVLKEASERSEHEDKTNKDTCCCGKLPNPKTRYVFSWMANDMMKEIQKLLKKREEITEIYRKDAPPGIVALDLTTHIDSTSHVQERGGSVDTTTSTTPSATNDDDVYESRAKVMKDVMEALADGSTNVVGVYGNCGVGKSTLLEDLERKIREDNLFHLVAKANVSQTPNLKEIQEEIAYFLGLEEIKSEEHPSVRAHMLRQRLQKYGKTKILIILDNLWKGLDLKKVGIPCEPSNKVVGCKLLLTSRFRDVLHKDMRSDKDFLVSKLEEKEAWRLFKKIVGSKVDDPKFKPLVDEVLKKCLGLPKPIVSIAKDLEHIPPSTWGDFLKSIKVSDDKGVGAIIQSNIEWSYDNLDNEDVRKLFITCGQVGISSIPVRNLLRYSIGVDLFGHDCRMEEARHRMKTLIHSLQDSCLLLDSNDSDTVKIDELVCEAAISIASKRENLIIVMRNDDDLLKKWPADVLKNCCAISLPNVDIHELPEGLECPKLKTFIMHSDNHFLEVPDSFFNSMEELKVLDLTGLCFTSLPSSIQSLENLQTLCLDDCSVEDVTILGKLRRLQVLSFRGSKLVRLPKEVGQLTELRLLDLSNCPKLETIEPGTLGSLFQLEDLYMGGSFDQWEIEDKVAARSNASLMELINLTKLRTLEISIPDATALPKDLPFGKLMRYIIQIGDIWDWSDEYKESRALELKLINLLPSMISFSNLTSLQVSKCSGLKTLLTFSTAKTLTHLTCLSVTECDALTEIVADGSEDPKDEITLSQLKYLKLQLLFSFSCFSSASYTLNFPSLVEVIVSQCPNMKIFSKGVLFAPRLEKVWIAEDGDARWADDLNKTVQQLFADKVALYNLENLKISESPEWKETWQGQLPFGPLNKLRSLTIEKCEFLSIAIPSDKLRLLNNLEVFHVRSCGLLEVMFELKEASSTGPQELLFHLNELSLRELPKLRHIWDGDFSGALCFKNLKALGIYNCNSLKYIMSTSMASDLPQLQKIEIKDCNMLEKVFINEREEDDEAKGLRFPLLDSVVLESLPNLLSFCSSSGVLECRILRTLTIANCPKMNTFISPFMKKQMLEIVDESGEIHVPATAFLSEKVLFPSLEQMTLSHLDNFKTIWHGQLSLELKNLETLQVADCNSIEELFSFHGLEVAGKGDAVMNLSLKEIELRGLPNLKHVWNGDLKGMVGFQNLETVRVCKCKKLKNLFPASIARGLRQLDKLDIEKCGLEEIIAKDDEEITKSVFPQITSLRFWILPKLKSFYPGIHPSKWPLLKDMVIYGCDQLEVFASEVQSFHQTTFDQNLEIQMKQPLFSTEKVAFPNLENLALDWNGFMRLTWHGRIPTQVFPKLKVLKLINSVDKSAVFPKALHQLQNLEKPVVSDSYFKDMTLYEGIVDKEEGTTRMTPLSREPKLDLVHGMTQLCRENVEGVAFQNLEILEVSMCHGLKSLVRSSISFRSLMNLEVSSCHGLISLMTSSTAKSLVHLTKLSVTNCKHMKQVVGIEGATAVEVIAFNRFKCLRLDSLPELESFFSGNSTIEIPLLEEITIKQCPKMRIFSNGALSTPESASLTFAGEEITLQEGNINVEIRKSFEEMVEFPSIEYLILSEFPEWIVKWDQFLVKSSCSLRYLEMDKCSSSSLSYAISSNLVQFLDKLEYLEVRNCDALEGIFDLDMHKMDRDGDQVPISLLSQINMIYLTNLPRLKHIWNQKQQDMLGFGNLILLEVNNCGIMEHLFTYTLAFDLPQLQELKIKNCAALKDIISEEAECEMKVAKDKIIFPCLRSILLDSLPNLANFYVGSLKLECPSLKSIRLVGCPNLTTFVSTFSKEDELMMGDKGAPESLSKNECKIFGTALFSEKVLFPSLEEMTLSCLDNFKTIWHQQIAMELKNLESLKVADCNSIEEVFSFNGPNAVAKGDDMTDMSLKEIELCRLPNLKHVWNGDLKGMVSFQNLKMVHVCKCDELKNLFPASIAKGLLQLDKLDIQKCGLEEIIAKGDEEITKFAFPQTTSLKFWMLPELRSFYPRIHSSDWPQLKDMVICGCDQLEAFASEVESFHQTSLERNLEIPPLFMTGKVAFPNLEKLRLDGNVRMREIWHGQIPADVFPKLKALELIEFKDVSAVFSNAFLQRLQSLEKIVVTDSYFEEMTLYEGIEEDEKSTTTMTPLSTQGDAFQNLEILEVSNCGGLWGLVPLLISFRSLMNLEVSSCQGLISLMTSSTAEGLVHLEKLSVTNCNNMKQVVESEKDAAADVIAFDRLKYLKLRHVLPLESFFSGYSTIDFPSLEEITVTLCPRMRIFSKGASCAPTSARLIYEGEEIALLEGDINAGIQNHMESWLVSNHKRKPKEGQKPDWKEG